MRILSEVKKDKVNEKLSIRSRPTAALTTQAGGLGAGARVLTRRGVTGPAEGSERKSEGGRKNKIKRGKGQGAEASEHAGKRKRKPAK